MNRRFPFAIRLAVVSLLAGLLGACGFRLAQELALPLDMQRIAVQTPEPYGVLQSELERALRRAGADLEGSAGVASLVISHAQLSQRPLSIGADGRVQEFALVYEASFNLLDANGQSKLTEETISLQRDYRFDAGEALGSPAEEALVREELEREMASAILRRLDAYFRQTAAAS